MKIINLKAENFKRLQAVDITPQDDTIIISGKNSQGKTSVLDSIWAALSWGSAAKEIPKPVRDGNEKASVELDLGDYVVKRNWVNGNSYLSVETKDGAKYNSPQKLLDGFIGDLSFDPLAFSRMSPKDQRNKILATVVLPFNLDEHNANRKEMYNERASLAPYIKRANGKAEGLEFFEGVPDETISASALMSNMEKANASLDKQTRLNREVENSKASVKENVLKINKLLAEVEDFKTLNISITQDADSTQKEATAMNVPTAEYLEKLQASIDSVDETNRKIQSNQMYTEAQVEAQKLNKQHVELTSQINKSDRKKSDALKTIKLPIAGLTILDDGIAFNDTPFIQCSSSEQLEVSLAMGIALNAELRVMRIKDGSLLDSDAMERLQKVAKENDMQVWIERVDNTGKIGVVIENGEVKR